MARNSSGTMTAPGSYPPVADSIINLDDYKALVQDIINEITNSLSREGDGGMNDALKLVDGTQSLPGLSFNSEAGSGLFRYTAGDVRLAVLGALIAKFTSAGLDVTGKVAATGPVSGTTGTFTAGLANDTSHGNRGGGTQHALATAAVAGFMPAADKAKLDTAASAATPSAIMQRDAAGRVQVATPAASGDAATKGYVDGILPVQATTVAAGRVSAAGALSSSFGTSSVVRDSLGTYTVTLSTTYSDIIPVAVVFDFGTRALVRISAITFSPNTTFTVVMRNPGDTAFIDAGFTFHVVRGP